ncbi:MAG: DUF421 domain-containing protein [Phycisphaera sp.]|nr:MAG: DUF421 domain-containing protein [Phycisphaera sp.]
MHIFFDGWEGIVRTLILGILAYVMIVTYLRLSGLRTLSKMNAFDFIVTIALGSTLASILLSKEVTLAEGTVAVGTLVGLQFLVTWISVRARWVRRAITGEPLLLLYNGELLDDALKRARVTPDEVHMALRGAGLQGMQNAHAVVLETDGTFTVLPQGEQKGKSSLDGVVGAPTA